MAGENLLKLVTIYGPFGYDSILELFGCLHLGGCTAMELQATKTSVWRPAIAAGGCSSTVTKPNRSQVTTRSCNQESPFKKVSLVIQKKRSFHHFEHSPSPSPLYPSK